jgi:hypothetical protein
MGTDNLFHKKKARELASLNRKGYGSRAPNQITLIVCEDEKSSRYYFKNFCKDHNLEDRVKVINCPNGTDPLSITAYAKKEKNFYQKIYCVFDKDRKMTTGNIKNYQQALNMCKGKIIAINSVPNFEYWLLLHHVKHSRPFAAKGKYTIGEWAEIELKKHMADYTKSAKNTYEKTKHLLGTAMKHADLIEKEQQEVQSDNPSTKIHWLIRDLLKLKK